MRRRHGIKDALQLRHTFGGENMGMIVFVRVQDAVDVEEDNVELHPFQSRGCVKPIHTQRIKGYF